MLSHTFSPVSEFTAQKDIPVVYTNYRLEVPTVFVFNVETSGIQQLQSSVTSGAINYQMSSGSLAKQYKRYTNIYNCTGRNLRALKKDDYVPAGKAYLNVQESGEAPQFIGFGGDTTGINEELRVKSEEFATAQYYDLQGRHVAQPTKGLYIVNGKKVVVK